MVMSLVNWSSMSSFVTVCGCETEELGLLMVAHRDNDSEVFFLLFQPVCALHLSSESFAAVVLRRRPLDLFPILASRLPL